MVVRWLPFLLLLAACNREAPVTTVACADPLAGCRIAEDVQLRFLQKPSALQPFAVEVTAPAKAAPHLRFLMQGMEMGMNRYRLLGEDGTHWHANVTLPACVQGRHDWMLQLEIGNKTYEMPFSAG